MAVGVLGVWSFSFAAQFERENSTEGSAHRVRSGAFKIRITLQAPCAAKNGSWSNGMLLSRPNAEGVLPASVTAWWLTNRPRCCILRLVVPLG